MVALLIFLSILLFINFVGMIADEEIENRKNFTCSFCVLVVAIMLIIR